MPGGQAERNFTLYSTRAKIKVIKIFQNLIQLVKTCTQMKYFHKYLERLKDI